MAAGFVTQAVVQVGDPRVNLLQPMDTEARKDAIVQKYIDRTKEVGKQEPEPEVPASNVEGPIPCPCGWLRREGKR
jgi:hypothetical protein